jgi:glycosyltransferase involved in cell wall biosynthesis
MFRPGVKTEGLKWVIRTCKLLYQQGHRFWLIIAGDGKEKDRLFRLAREKLPQRVRFVGSVPRDQLYQCYSAADIFVFPGIQESLGMVYLESQSCGLPVVAFDNAGVADAIQDGITGFLVPLNDSRRFAEAIGNLLSDGELRRKMGEAAKDYVRENHDLDQNYQKLEIVLHKTVES